MKYRKGFKQKTIKLSDEIGTKKASEQFGLTYLYFGRLCKRKKEVTENKSMPLTEREKNE